MAWPMLTTMSCTGSRPYRLHHPEPAGQALRAGTELVPSPRRAPRPVRRLPQAGSRSCTATAGLRGRCRHRALRGPERAEYRDFMRTCNAVQEHLIDCPKPVIAACTGTPWAAGSDSRSAVTSSSRRMTRSSACLRPSSGCCPAAGDAAAAPLIGTVRAAELIMTGWRISGAQAASWGPARDRGDGERPEAAQHLAGVSRPRRRSRSGWPRRCGTGRRRPARGRP